MIDINTYRSRIGQFSQKIKNKKYLYTRKFYRTYCWNENKTGKNAITFITSIFKISLLVILLCPTSSPGQACQAGVQRHSVHGTLGGGDGNLALLQLRILIRGKRTTNNFNARYLYGNKKQKGIHNFHLNI